MGSGGVITGAIVLSRLVRDNGYSTEFAGRIVDYEDGKKQVVPAYTFEYRVTYRARPEDRDWLTAEEAAELRTVLDAYWANREELPDRLNRAISLTDGMVHQRTRERHLVFVVTALEALLNTDAAKATKQFVTRVPLLATELGVADISRRFANQMYTARSQAAHGADVELFLASTQQEVPSDDGDEDRTAEGRRDALTVAEQGAVSKVIRLRELLRAGIRKAIEDDEFRAVFESTESVRQRWPVDIG